MCSGRIPGPLLDDRPGDGHHLGIEFTLRVPNCDARTPSAARNVNSAIPVPRGSTITIRSRRVRYHRATRGLFEPTQDRAPAQAAAKAQQFSFQISAVSAF
jgi:hypothetical protein